MLRPLELAIAVLNGAVGDYLARTGNGLATEFVLAHDGAVLPVDRASLARVHPNASNRVVVLVHGLMCTEDIFRFRDGGDYGSMLERDLGFTPLYVRYNSGLPIEANGASLARLLEDVVREYPVDIEELLLLGHSMGGLVIRSACHAAVEAGLGWVALAKSAIYIGTPHRGAPLERAGRVVSRLLDAIPDPYTRLVAELAELRSHGIKDLGDPAHPLPLLPTMRHYLIAGTISLDPTLTTLFGDAIVPLASATDALLQPQTRGALPPDHVKVFHGINHLGLATDAKVYEQVRAFASERDATLLREESAE
ncbi:MAG: alpha/beta hydrolase [Polyangiaceae bacterium]|nr:alpha/beta hydrolase [Polyangiaceae bacterium]